MKNYTEIKRDFTCIRGCEFIGTCICGGPIGWWIAGPFTKLCGDVGFWEYPPLCNKCCFKWFKGLGDPLVGAGPFTKESKDWIYN